MKKDYFIVVLAHSFHGRLRRIHIPHQIAYSIIALALIGGITVLGFLSSYAKMAWKVADYNSLQSEFDTLRERYQTLQQEASQKNEQLATLQMFATEVSLAFGIDKQIEGPINGVSDTPLLPSYKDTLEKYNFLKSTQFSIFSRKYPRLWQKNTRPTLWPVNARLNSYFGKRTNVFTGIGTPFHPGVDIQVPSGTRVRAAGDGIVIRAEWAGSYGRLIAVDHGNGIITRYGHLSRFDVIAGQEVRRGQVIGLSGASGRVTGPHLHYEIRQGGNAINPYIFLKSAARPANETGRDFPF